jgi:predicted DNA binding CopG/RHH family protein
VSDAYAEKFVDAADISRYDLSAFNLMRFEFEPKAAAMHMRLPQNLLDALKAKAQAKGMTYTRYVRLLLGADMAH